MQITPTDEQQADQQVETDKERHQQVSVSCNHQKFGEHDRDPRDRPNTHHAQRAGAPFARNLASGVHRHEDWNDQTEGKYQGIKREGQAVEVTLRFVGIFELFGSQTAGLLFCVRIETPQHEQDKRGQGRKR